MAKIRLIIYRSLEEQPYCSLYSTQHCKTLRRQAVTYEDYRYQHSGCGALLQAGRVHPRSAVVYDLKPHEGDLKLFFDLNNLQTVCWRCHSVTIQLDEAWGYDTTIGADG